MHNLYDLWQKGIMPWQWDWENYSGKNKDMVGFFYSEDLENILQIQIYEREYNRLHPQR